MNKEKANCECYSLNLSGTWVTNSRTLLRSRKLKFLVLTGGGGGLFTMTMTRVPQKRQQFRALNLNIASTVTILLPKKNDTKSYFINNLPLKSHKSTKNQPSYFMSIRIHMTMFYVTQQLATDTLKCLGTVSVFTVFHTSLSVFMHNKTCFQPHW